MSTSNISTVLGNIAAPAFVGSTSGAPGVIGLVPAPAANPNEARVLTDAGTFQGLSTIRPALDTPPKITRFVIPGVFTFTPDPLAKYAMVELVGAGGAGAGCAATGALQNSAGSAGGGSTYLQMRVSAAQMGTANRTVTVGAAGVGGTGNGTAGGTSSIDSMMITPGGSPGTTVAPSGGEIDQTGGAGNSSQSFSGAALIKSITGQRGGTTACNSGGSFRTVGGAGASYIGLGTLARPVSGAGGIKLTGQTGSGYGSGSSGTFNSASQTATSAVDAQDGAVFIVEYYQ